MAAAATAAAFCSGSTIRFASSRLSPSAVLCSEPSSSSCSAAACPSLASSALSFGGRPIPARREIFSRRNSPTVELPSIMTSRADSTSATVVRAAAKSSTAADEVRIDEASLKTAASPLTMTYLEGNSWLWEILGTKILIDPVLVGNLDFGIPWLYDGAKKFYKDFKLNALPEIDYMLITQSYDDHCHEKTLGPLSELQPDISVIATPNAEKLLSKYFKKVTYLDPIKGESTTIKAKNGSDVVFRASPGPVLGPPWQRPENGYFVDVKEPKYTIYYEPHCVFAKAKLDQERADVLVTPVIKQVLPGYTLVSGQEDAVKVAEWLQPEFVVTMANGELDTKGILSKLVQTSGTTSTFKELLAKVSRAQVLEPTAGVPLEVPIGPKA